MNNVYTVIAYEDEEMMAVLGVFTDIDLAQKCVEASDWSEVNIIVMELNTYD